MGSTSLLLEVGAWAGWLEVQIRDAAQFVIQMRNCSSTKLMLSNDFSRE